MFWLEFLKCKQIMNCEQHSGVDPTKLFFFPNEEFFRFLLVSLHFYYIQKKKLLIKKWLSLTPKKKNGEKKVW